MSGMSMLSVSRYARNSDIWVCMHGLHDFPCVDQGDSTRLWNVTVVCGQVCKEFRHLGVHAWIAWTSHTCEDQGGSTRRWCHGLSHQCYKNETSTGIRYRCVSNLTVKETNNTGFT